MNFEEIKPIFDRHRIIATQLEAIYQEINKLATKKPTEKITSLISKKINLIIIKIRELISGDDFLDAVETIPIDGNLIRLDETLVILGELRGILDRQWSTKEFEDYRKYYNINSHAQIMR